MFDDHHGLRVTDVRVNLNHSPADLRVKAFANLVLNDAVAVTAIRIVEMGNGRLIVAMPNRRRSDGTRSDTTFPIDHQARRWLNAIVLREFERECRRSVTEQLQAAG